MDGSEFKKRRKELGLTQDDLGKLLGVSKRTVINYEKGEVIPGTKSEILHKIFDGKHYEADKPDKMDVAAEDVYVYEKKSQRAKMTYEPGKGRPFYDIDFTLGIQEIGEDDRYNPDFNIDFPPANKESINWYPARGNSMLGDINSGDYLALEEIKDFSWFPLGQIYGIVTKNGIRTIKKIVKSEDKDSFLLVSSNPDKFNYPDQDIPKEMIKKLFRVAWVIKELD